MQTLYLATHFNPIYWNTACLIVNSGSLEDNSEEEIVDIYTPESDDLTQGVTFEDLPDRKGKIRKTSSTDYTKMATAIGMIRKAGIKLSLIDINKSELGFKPDVENNQILFGLKGVSNINNDFVEQIINNRPYVSPKDFFYKVKPKRQAMVSLIKAGAFDGMMDRKLCMGWYIWETCDKKNRLTLQNMSTLLKYDIIPNENDKIIMGKRIYEFTRYLKLICKNDKITYILDERAINFLTEIGCEELIYSSEEKFYIKAKAWDAIYQKWMDLFRNWLLEHKDEALKELNMKIFKEDWNKYALKNISAWEMESLCFYYHEHELAHVNRARYGIINFFNLPEDPIVDRSFTKGEKTINLFKLYKICGTCIAKNKTKSTVSLLTPEGVVNVKLRREQFSLYDKQISEVGEDGKKKVKERSWFNRGNMIMLQGFRSGDNFIPKKYANSGMPHTLYHIDSIDKDGFLTLRTDRYKGDNND